MANFETKFNFGDIVNCPLLCRRNSPWTITGIEIRPRWFSIGVSYEVFSCKHCLFQADADYNASCNHEQKLPSASFMRQRLDKNGEFIWKTDGFFRLDGSEITVPDKKNKQYHKR